MEGVSIRQSLHETLVYNSAILDQYLSRLAAPPTTMVESTKGGSSAFSSLWLSLIPPIRPNYCHSYAQFERDKDGGPWD